MPLLLGTASSTCPNIYYYSTQPLYTEINTATFSDNWVTVSSTAITSTTVNQRVIVNGEKYFYYTPTTYFNYGSYPNYFPSAPSIIKKTHDLDIKSSIKRALKLMDKFGLADQAKLFFSGEDIEISHPDSIYKFVISKIENTLFRYTKNPPNMSPFNLSLYTKSNVFVADLCTYLKSTPIIDQLFSMFIIIKSGEENVILEKANYFGLTKDKELLQYLSEQTPNIQNKLLRP